MQSKMYFFVKRIKELYGIFIIFIISVFIFSFFFQFLDNSSQKIIMRDFYQKVTFKQYFTSTSSLCFCVLIVCLFDWVFCVFRLLFIKKFVGGTWPKEEVTKRKIWILILDTKKNREFSEIPFICIFNDFGFLLDISMKINLHVWFILLSSLQ